MLSEENVFPSKAAFVRLSAVSSILSAWQSTCTYIACVNTARKIGLHPCNVTAALQSEYVTILSSDQKERYDNKIEKVNKSLNISAARLTDPEIFKKIFGSVIKNSKFAYLCIPFGD